MCGGGGLRQKLCQCDIQYDAAAVWRRGEVASSVPPAEITVGGPCNSSGREEGDMVLCMHGGENSMGVRSMALTLHKVVTYR